MPNDFTFSKIEEKILKFWKDRKIFEKTVENRKHAKRFVFFDGPPFATGLPHYGHILASTIKDVVPRFFTMKGFRVDRRWGWDCHGLPIENIIEQQLEISGRKSIERYGIGKFNQKAREQVLRFADEWERTVDRVGRFVDFRNSYKTMDATYMESVWWAFSQVNKKGLVYKDSRISLYCPRCETPLSNFEIAMDESYKELEDESVYVKFKLKPNQKIGKIKTEGKTYILAWTTTPWTLPGNVSLAVGKDIIYVLTKKDNVQLLVAKDLLSKLSGNSEVLEEITGKNLVGLEYEPLFNIEALNEENTPNYKNAFKVVIADFVSTREGTGVVHIAPAFGEEDFGLAKKENLPSFLTVNDSGYFFDWVDGFGGKFVFEANHLVIDDLKSRDLLLGAETIRHSYPVCYRCENKLLYKQQPAWFVAISKVKKKMLSTNKKIDWHPAHLREGRFGKGLETAPDWNVSRSRFFGTPLPIWECEKCKEHKIVGSLDELEKYRYRGKNKYFIMRHGETALKRFETSGSSGIVASKLEQDRYDLIERGIKEAERAGEHLKTLGGIDHVFASPFLRTKHTAQIIAKKFGTIAKADKRLKELDHGIACEGKPSNECFSEFPRTMDTKNPDGESLREVKARIFSMLKELDEKYEGQKILLVSHGDPLWILESLALGFSDEETMAKRPELYVKQGQVKEIHFKNFPYNEAGDIDMHRPYVDDIFLKCEKCEGKMVRLTDVFDCWFESGSMPYGQAHFPFENKKQFEDNFPADFISEYIAQTRGWFYTMHVLATAIFNKPAFKHVVTTGTILAENGEKLSKSKRNFPDPQLLIDKYGADSLRYYLMTSSVMASDNILFSEKSIDEIYKKYILILSNVLRFWELYEGKYTKSDHRGVRGKTVKRFDEKRLEKIDEWILSRLETTKKLITDAFEKYEIMDGCRAAQPFIDDLSLWYVRRNRERIRNGQSSGETAFFVLSHVLLELSKLIAPVTPFIADHIYKRISNQKESVHLEDWPKENKKFINLGLEAEMRELREFITAGLAQRKAKNIKVRQPLASATVTGKAGNFDVGLEKLFKAELNVKGIVYDSAIQAGPAGPVKLDEKLTHELVIEGYAREISRQVQDMRKEAKYKLDEKVVAAWESENVDIIETIDKFGKEIAGDTLLSDFRRGHQPKEIFDVEKEIKLAPQITIWLGVRSKRGKLNE